MTKHIIKLRILQGPHNELNFKHHPELTVEWVQSPVEKWSEIFGNGSKFKGVHRVDFIGFKSSRVIHFSLYKCNLKLF